MSKKYNDSKIPTLRYIRESQLIPFVVPFSHATLWRMCKSGTFPRPIKLAERITVWDINEVRAWLESKEQKRVSV